MAEVQWQQQFIWRDAEVGVFPDFKQLLAHAEENAEEKYPKGAKPDAEGVERLNEHSLEDCLGRPRATAIYIGGGWFCHRFNRRAVVQVPYPPASHG
jgi:hypothetical protein